MLYFWFLFQVVSSVSSRLHLNRLSRAELSVGLTDFGSTTWRRLCAGVDDCGARLRHHLAGVKVPKVPKVNMPKMRNNRKGGWCNCFQVLIHSHLFIQLLVIFMLASRTIRLETKSCRISYRKSTVKCDRT